MARDWRTTELSPREAGLCAFAEKLTQRGDVMREDDVRALRELGLSDAAIHDAIQVVAYFNYINRVAHAVDVDLEPGMPPHERP